MRRRRTPAGRAATAQPLGHLVEGARERALLGAALDGGARRRGRRRDPAGGLARAGRIGRAIWRAISAPATSPSTRTTRPSSAEAEDRAPDGAVDGGDALGDPHGADRPAVAEDRHGGRQDLGAEGVAVARFLVGLAAEGGRDLGPVGIAAPRSRQAPALSAITRARASRRRSPGRAGSPPRRRPGAAASAVWRARGAPARSPPPRRPGSRACARTSASTRSRRLTASGTPNAIRASSST